MAIPIDQQFSWSHNIYYNVFLELIWLHMYVCFCCVTNKFSESLNPKFAVRCLTMKATIRRLKYVRSPQSEVWKLMSKVHNLKSDVRSLTKSVWFMSKVWSAMYVCSKPEVQKPKSEVQSMSKVQNPSLKPKSEVCQLSKSESEVQSLTNKIWSWKSEVESLSEVLSKFFAIIITVYG